MQYKVVNQSVEINGVTYTVGSIVTDANFKDVEIHVVDKTEANPAGREINWSEKESLLATGHIVIINE